MAHRLRLAAFGLALCSLAVGPAIAAETESATQPTLKICLNENLPPFSLRKGRSGFDVALADAIGESLAQPVAIRWFENELDADKSLSLEANALLSDGLCDLLGNFPLTEDSLERPRLETSRLPDYDGAKPTDRRRRVPLGTLIPSRPVRFDALGVILGPAAPARSIYGLGDLAGLRIGSETGTFADIVMMRFGNGRLVDDITHVVPGRGRLLEKVDAGEFDAAMVDLGRLDAYRANHPDTKVTASGFHYRLGFNMGFVALSTQQNLIDRVNHALSELRAAGKIEAIAKASGVTLLAPHEPEISPHILLKDLQD
jgi:ABC-type amino acid transport substrate-binding protein